MRINLDISSANNKGTGICTFENEIIRRIVTLNPEYDFCGCTNFRRKLSKKSFSSLPFEISYSYIPYKLVYNYSVPIFYEHMMMSKSDLNLFCTYDLPNVRYAAPTIGTIHDIILQKVRSEKEEMINWYDRKLRHTISVSDHILTVSEATKQDLIEYYNIPEKNITVVYNGVDYNRFANDISLEEKEKIREKYELPETFFLYFGGIRKHKNIESIINAYSLLPEYIRQDYKLVITKGSEELRKLAYDKHVSRDVLFTRFIDDEDKECIYQLAYATIFVSYYEGFGLPIVESMASGTPVITSNVSSMPEVAGDAALLVNPYDVEDIANAMNEMVNDKKLYNNLIEMGKQNVTRFSWDTSASVVSELIKQMS